MTGSAENLNILIFEPKPDRFEGFYDALRRRGHVEFFGTAQDLFNSEADFPNRICLFDVRGLKETPAAQVTRLVDRRGVERMGLIADCECEDYLTDLATWGLHQVCVKVEPLNQWEVSHFLDCLCEPANGFGLSRYLTHTVEMYAIFVSTIEEKNRSIERVINHFASSGFDIHDLYDVRLILEETLNNCFFHAFKTSTGEEKYRQQSFDRLAPGDKVRIEYGNSGDLTGFTVTDSAGTLPIRRVFDKLERQINKDGLFDTSGRGLYLSRMLSTSFIINIEEGRRTQFVALFDERRRLDRPKPFIINYIGRDQFSQWRRQPEYA